MRNLTWTMEAGTVTVKLDGEWYGSHSVTAIVNAAIKRRSLSLDLSDGTYLTAEECATIAESDYSEA